MGIKEWREKYSSNPHKTWEMYDDIHVLIALLKTAEDEIDALKTTIRKPRFPGASK